MLGIGLGALRATLIPMFCVWGFAAFVVAAYYLIPTTEPYFRLMHRLHIDYGALAVVAERIVFCGIVPGIFMVALKGLRQRRVLAICLMQTVWSCLWGVICDAVFRLQAFWFGSGTACTTVLLKTCVDQFLFTPFVISPASAVFCFWLARDLSFRQVQQDWPRRFFRELVAPNLFVNWCIAIPVTALMFLFPTALQIHVNSLNASFAALIFLQVGKKSSSHSD